MISDKIFIVDLGSGRYVDKLIGFECFNLICNSIDDMYYGYVPPKGGVDVSRIDKDATGVVSGVLVVYVRAISNANKNREIIAYCENASVYAVPQSGERLNRQFEDTDGAMKSAPYHIVSDNLVDLHGLERKFTITIANYNIQMFRKQRSYLEQYPQLKSDILSYICKQKSVDKDDGVEQVNIQSSMPASAEMSKKYSERPDEIVRGSGSLQIKKNPAIAKKVLNDNAYKCLIDLNHVTFKTSAGVWYMEGHHLIPCTVDNSEKFNSTSKLDREENIVCICPNCHRAIHYGDENIKKTLIAKLHKSQLSQLTSAGLGVSLDELQELYRI